MNPDSCICPCSYWGALLGGHCLGVCLQPVAKKYGIHCSGHQLAHSRDRIRLCHGIFTASPGPVYQNALYLPLLLDGGNHSRILVVFRDV